MPLAFRSNGELEPDLRRHRVVKMRGSEGRNLGGTGDAFVAELEDGAALMTLETASAWHLVRSDRIGHGYYRCHVCSGNRSRDTHATPIGSAASLLLRSD